MPSLADELLNDLDDGVKEEDEDQPEAAAPLANPLKRKVAFADDERMSEDDDGGGDDEDEDENDVLFEGGVAPGGIVPAQELDEEEVAKLDMGGVDDVRNVAKLEGSKRMVEVLQVSLDCLP